MKSTNLFYLLIIISLVNCETISLVRRIRNSKAYHSNLFKVKHTLNHQAKMKGIVESIQNHGAEFIKGFVNQLVEKLTGVNADQIIQAITTGCTNFDEVMTSLVIDIAPTDDQKSKLESSAPQLIKIKSCSDLKNHQSDSMIIEPVSLPDTGPCTKVGQENEKAQEMEFISTKDRNNFIHYFKFQHIVLYVTATWFEIVNAQNNMRISTAVDKGTNAISHQEQQHALLLANTKTQNWECIDHQNGVMEFKNEEKAAFMKVDETGSWKFDKTSSDRTKFTIWKTPTFDKDTSKLYQEYGNKVQKWMSDKKEKIDCAIQKFREIVPVNPIDTAIRNIIMLQVGKVVAHILLGVFTLGIGNVILEFASWTATMLQGGFALLFATKFFIQTLSDLTAGKEIQKNVQNLGRCVPQFFQAILKFFGSGGRRQALRNRMKTNVNKIVKSLNKHRKHY